MKRIFSDSSDGVSFEDFMNRALYDERGGYYSRSISNVGRTGDFTTTAEIAPALGTAVAVWAAAAMKENDCYNLIELGPGSGKLAEAVWSRLPRLTRWRTRHVLVESSPRLQKMQQNRRGLRHAHWCHTIEQALSQCNGRACLYSNEFFDAFPVRIFQKTADQWRELFLRVNEQGCLVEFLHSCETLPQSTIWEIPSACGQRVEIHQSVRDWLEKLAGHWRGGAMLGIDYGAEASALYHRKPMGTIRAYLAHQRIEGAGVYQNMGLQDLTADVNFSDLLGWSEAFTCNQELQSQQDFLAPFVDHAVAGDMCAIDPDGAGGAFQVWRCVRRAHH